MCQDLKGSKNYLKDLPFFITRSILGKKTFQLSRHCIFQYTVYEFDI